MTRGDFVFEISDLGFGILNWFLSDFNFANPKSTIRNPLGLELGRIMTIRHGTDGNASYS